MALLVGLFPMSGALADDTIYSIPATMPTLSTVYKSGTNRLVTFPTQIKRYVTVLAKSYYFDRLDSGKHQWNTTKTVELVQTYRYGTGAGRPWIQTNDGGTTRYFSYQSDIRPAPMTLSFNVGAANAGKQVEILNYKGNVVATVTAGANGAVTWDPKGYVLYLPYSHSFAQRHYTSDEIVASNDCATFVSHILSAGGIGLYEPYTEGVDSGSGVFACLRDSGVNCEGSTKGSIPLSHAVPGDVIWIGNSGHVMFVAEYSETTQKYHVYAHSTSHKNVATGWTDNCWVSKDLTVNRIAHTGYYVYRYRLKDSVGNIKVIKKDEDTGAMLQGAEFDLQDSEGNVINHGTTNANGEILFEELEPGDYTVVETKAPAGYK